MKVIEKNSQKLIMRDSGLFMKLWCILMPLFCSIVLIILLRNYNSKLEIPVIMCCVFIVMGLFGLIFMQKQLMYVFDKDKDSVCIYYPVYFATKYETEIFQLSDIKYVSKKIALSSGYKSGPNNIIYRAAGFDFVLKSGKKINSGLYSSDHDEINELIKKIVEFIDIPVMEVKDNDEPDL